MGGSWHTWSKAMKGSPTPAEPLSVNPASVRSANIHPETLQASFCFPEPPARPFLTEWAVEKQGQEQVGPMKG